ncbi:putative lcrS [Escherichia coli PA48]|nr:lcrS [Escherichia coli EC96038]EKK62286.1 putative lcrS [Escherichia coli 10.0869]ELV93200.1 putative lcrS [Escherichia coli PA48]
MKEIAIRKAPFTEHQIIAVIKSLEYGRTVKDVAYLKPLTTTASPDTVVWNFLILK